MNLINSKQLQTRSYTASVICLFSIIGLVNSEINHRTSNQIVQETHGNFDEAIKKDCNKSYNVTCLKLDIVSFVDKISEEKYLGVLPGVLVVKENISSESSPSDVVANLARSFPNDMDKRLDAYLLHKIGTYLNTHSISIKLFDEKTFEAARNLNNDLSGHFGLFGNSNTESGRKKDKNGYGGTLMAGLMMMKGTLGAISFGALAMLAGKALMTGLMALMLSAIVGLKTLTGGAEKKTTYEIVSKPVYTAPHTYSTEEVHPTPPHSGYGRSLENASSNIEEAIHKYGNVRDRRSI